jgi:hypothetical protein
MNQARNAFKSVKMPQGGGIGTAISAALGLGLLGYAGYNSFYTGAAASGNRGL